MKAEMDMQAMQKCMDDCCMCGSMCSETTMRCMTKGSMTPQMMTMLQDCIQMCQMACDCMMRHSTMAGKVCTMCAEMCMSCASMCEKMGGDEMKRCAEMCKRCAESCKAMAKTSVAASA
jgi:hypothetical protein